MDLRCRKALSTFPCARARRARARVNGSEMPKGVEHCPSCGHEYCDHCVNGSEMPKGVEHFELFATGKAGVLVNGSEMPKGVEHNSCCMGRINLNGSEWI